MYTLFDSSYIKFKGRKKLHYGDRVSTVVSSGKWGRGKILRKEDKGTLFAHGNEIDLHLDGGYIEIYICKICQGVHVRFIYIAKSKLYLN